MVLRTEKMRRWVNFDEAQLAALDLEAQRQGRTFCWLVRKCIELALPTLRKFPGDPGHKERNDRMKRTIAFALVLFASPAFAFGQSIKSDATYERKAHAAATYALKTDLIAVPGTYLPGKPDASAVLLAYLPTTSITIPANLAGTRCKAGTNPTSTATLSLQRNTVEVATIQIATNGAITFSTQAAITVSTTQEMTLVAPSSQDATLAGVRCWIHATR